jgi:hypothetical protein
LAFRQQTLPQSLCLPYCRGLSGEAAMLSIWGDAAETLCGLFPRHREFFMKVVRILVET